MSKVDEITKYIRHTIADEFNKGLAYVDVRAGDIFLALRDDLELTGAKQVCEAMRKIAKDIPSQWTSDNNIENSTTVTYRYYKYATIAQANEHKVSGKSILEQKKQPKASNAIFSVKKITEH